MKNADYTIGDRTRNLESPRAPRNLKAAHNSVCQEDKMQQ